MTDVAVHLMAPEHALRVRAVRLRALEDAPDAFGTLLAEDLARPIPEWTTRLENPQAATFLAIVEGQDVGLVTSLPWPGREGAVGLFSMWVAPEARRLGVGKALMDRVAQWARAGGYQKIYLGVGDFNEPAITLYRRCGYERTGVVETLPAPREHILEHERMLDLTKD